MTVGVAAGVAVAGTCAKGAVGSSFEQETKPAATRTIAPNARDSRLIFMHHPIVSSQSLARGTEPFEIDVLHLHRVAVFVRSPDHRPTHPDGTNPSFEFAPFALPELLFVHGLPRSSSAPAINAKVRSSVRYCFTVIAASSNASRRASARAAAMRPFRLAGMWIAPKRNDASIISRAISSSVRFPWIGQQ